MFLGGSDTCFLYSVEKCIYFVSINKVKLNRFINNALLKINVKLQECVEFKGIPD